MFCIYTQTDLTFLEHMYVLKIKKKKRMMTKKITSSEEEED